MPLGVPPGPPAPLSFSVSVLNFARAPPPAPPGAVARGERATARAAPAATGRAVSLSVLVPNEHHKWKVSFFFPASFIGCAGAHRSSRHDCREAGDVWVTLVKTSNVEYFYEKLIDTP